MFFPDWNRGWLFAKGDAREEDLHFEEVSLPHSNKILPLNYFDEKEFQFVSTYWKRFEVKAIGESHFLLSFEGFGNALQASLNGKPFLSSPYGYVGERVDVTPYLQEGENLLEVILDSEEDPSTPPFGGLLDYLSFGGLYRKSHLEEVPSSYIDRAEISYLGGNKAKVSLTKIGDAPLRAKIRFFGNGGDHSFVLKETETILEFPSLQLWSPKEPSLYKVTIEYLGRTIAFEYGFRKIEIEDNRLRINGEEIVLFGLNRHQSYPYLGYASTEGMERNDARKLYELGLNFVRLSHYPMSEAFLSECDRLGLLCLEEIPGWQHLGDSAWQEKAIAYLKKMIARDFNHPSIAFWGVRINESPDCHSFYAKTNQLAKKLDPTRLRAGVRCIQKSELLEDVYSWNDFSFREDEPILDPHDVLREGDKTPILITEFGGHTYPTRANDNEERCLEQALRHALIQEAVREKEGFLGASGWCAFDYNTHHSFGSGDKICYHGVCDIFRLDKMAASFYKGQRDRSRGLFLDCSSSWAFGERNYGGVTPLYIFTNCDSVSLEMNGKRFVPEKDPRFFALPHPIFRVDSLGGAWGQDWNEATLTGYIDGQPVLKKTLLADSLPTSLKMDTSCREMGDADAVYVSVQLLDQAGNPLRRSTDVLALSVSNGILVGPDAVSLNAGGYAFYVKGNKPGEMLIKAECRGLIIKKKVDVYEENDF